MWYNVMLYILAYLNFYVIKINGQVVKFYVTFTFSRKSPQEFFCPTETVICREWEPSTV